MKINNGLTIELEQSEKDSLNHVWHILNHIDSIIDNYLESDDNRDAKTKLVLEYGEDAGGGVEEWNEDIFGIINIIESLAGCERIFYRKEV